MELNTIDMPVAEAEHRLAEYRESLRHNRNSEDEAIAAGYRAAARGMPILSLSETIDAGGFFDNGLPRIAIVRADATQCFVTQDMAGSWKIDLVFSRNRDSENRGALVGADTVRVHTSREWNSRDSWRRGSTIVPNIPPPHRPNPRRLHRFHILWEVEKWTMVAPRDPALLKHIGGDLWAVMAVWDLTDLERAVLAGSRR
jgi:hypothetical protein